MLSKVHCFIQSSTIKAGLFKNYRTDSSNNTNSFSGFQGACSSMIKRSDIKSTKSPKAVIFPNVYLFCNKARKRIENIEQKLINVEHKALKNL